MKKIILFLTIVLLAMMPFSKVFADSYWLRGGVIGMGAGGLGLGLATGLKSSSTCNGGRPCEDEGDFDGLEPTGIALGSAVGAVLGFGIGALVGAAFEKNKPSVSLNIDPENKVYSAGVRVPF
jgi:hypothetical protein